MINLRTAARDLATMKRLFTSAEVEAARDGADTTGAEHLLLAALDLPDGTARRAFERAGHDPDAYREAVAGQHAAALATVGVAAHEPVADNAAAPPARGPMRSTATAQQVFQAATGLARDDGRRPLVGAHLVLAVTDLRHGSAVRALRQMGIDPARLADAARAELVETRSA